MEIWSDYLLNALFIALSYTYNCLLLSRSRLCLYKVQVELAIIITSVIAVLNIAVEPENITEQLDPGR